jgi:hypothetical protein
MDWCEAEDIRYVFSLSGNDVLRSLVEPGHLGVDGAYAGQSSGVTAGP